MPPTVCSPAAWGNWRFTSTAKAWSAMPFAGPSSCIACSWDCSPSDMHTLFIALLAVGALSAAEDTKATALLNGARLKDLVSIEGVRENQLIGYGLVVGLAGTGDKRQVLFSAQSLT